MQFITILVLVGFAYANCQIYISSRPNNGYLLKVAVAQVQSLSDRTFNYLGTDGHLYTGLLISNKAHNIVLDTVVSVGLLGCTIYMFLLGFCLWCNTRTVFWGIEVVAIAYLIYTLTWYESAQFSHLAWWSLSIGISSVELVKSATFKET